MASKSKVLGKASLNFEELTTMLTEIEAVLNSRPLSYVHENASEPQPLTPSFLGQEKTNFSSAKDFADTVSCNKREQRGHGPEMEVPAETHDQLLEPLDKGLPDGLKISPHV